MCPLFGDKSNGTTLTTRSIKKGIEFILKNGVGRQVLDFGRYLTGIIYLKSNGAIQVGSPKRGKVRKEDLRSVSR